VFLPTYIAGIEIYPDVAYIVPETQGDSEVTQVIRCTKPGNDNQLFCFLDSFDLFICIVYGRTLMVYEFSCIDTRQGENH